MDLYILNLIVLHNGLLRNCMLLRLHTMIRVFSKFWRLHKQRWSRGCRGMSDEFTSLILGFLLAVLGLFAFSTAAPNRTVADEDSYAQHHYNHSYLRYKKNLRVNLIRAHFHLRSSSLLVLQKNSFNSDSPLNALDANWLGLIAKLFEIKKVGLVGVACSNRTVHLPSEDEFTAFEQIHLYLIAFEVLNQVLGALRLVEELDAAVLVGGEILEGYCLLLPKCELDSEVVFILDEVDVLGLEMCPNVLFVRV